MILRILGALLLLAAGLKLHGLAVEPVGSTGFFSSPWVQMLIVEWEIALGIWLLWGASRSLAWLAATATFVAFAMVSLWQAWIGQVTCGCLGAIIRIDPWLAFAIDWSALTLLGCARRSAAGSQPNGRVTDTIRFLATGACGVSVVLGLFALMGTLSFGSPAAALAYMRGERLSVQPGLVDIGEGYIGEQTQIVVQVRNWTDRPIRIVGGTSDCSCILTNDLPLTVPPNDRADLTVIVRLKAPAGQFTRRAKLFTDDTRIPAMTFRLTGRSYKPVWALSAELNAK